MALGLAGVFAIASRIAANAAALLTSLALVYAVRLVVADDTTDAVIIGILAAASIVGWTLRTFSWRATNDTPARDIWAPFGIVLQVAPLFLVVLLLVIVSGFSIPSGRPGVSAGVSPEWFLLACGIGLFAFATTFSRTAATICAVLTCRALILAVWIAEGGNGGFGIMLGTAATLSLLGWMLRQIDRTGDRRQVTAPS